MWFLLGNFRNTLGYYKLQHLVTLLKGKMFAQADETSEKSL